MAKKVFLQVQCSYREREKMAQIAADRDMSMSQVVRAWVNDAYKRLEKKRDAA